MEKVKCYRCEKKTESIHFDIVSKYGDLGRVQICNDCNESKLKELERMFDEGVIKITEQTHMEPVPFITSLRTKRMIESWTFTFFNQ